MRHETKALIGVELNRAVALALGYRIYPVRFHKPGTDEIARTVWALRTNDFELPDYSGNIVDGWPIIKAWKICLDAGDGSFKKDKAWSAWLAQNAPVMAEDEITASDPLVAAMRAFAHSVHGDFIELED